MGKSKHGDGSILPGRRVPEYRAWANMRHRCNNPASSQYPRYGARGVRVCERWADYRAFLADMGRRPSHAHSIERIDVNGNYEPSNCRWATAKEQARNRRNGRTLSLDGATRTMAEWSEVLGIPWSTINNRLLRGWDAERALRTPRLAR